MLAKRPLAAYRGCSVGTAACHHVEYLLATGVVGGQSFLTRFVARLISRVMNTTLTAGLLRRRRVLTARARFCV
jgi:hypothetical protein